MTTVQIEAGTLTASRESRTVTGLLLPYGEVGRTNLGKFAIEPGAITVPDDLTGLVFNDEHRRESPIGAPVTLTDTPAGIVGTFAVAKTPAGDRALDDIENKRRTSLSAEVSDIVLRAGKAVAGTLFGGALVKTGAFPSASLFASDVGELPEDYESQAVTTETITVDGVEYVRKTTSTYTTETTPVAGDNSEEPSEETTEDDESNEEEPTMTATRVASAPADQRRASRKPGIESAGDLYARIAAAHGTPNAGTMLAALDNMIQGDIQPAQEPQWLAEIWGSRTFERRFVPLITHAPLTAMKAVGWKFTADKTPTVGDYAGFPAQPTSTETKTEAVTVNAARIAGAAAFDRAFVDFSVPGFWEGFYRELSNDYARKSDAKVPAFLATGATAVEAGTVPTGVATAASYIVDGAISILEAEIGLPTFAIVGTDLWREFVLTKKDDMLAYLNIALGLEDGSLENFRIVPSSAAAYEGKVLVGVKDCATFFELPGSPIRIDTVSVADGGGQTGLTGYYATLVNNAKGLALVEPEEG